MLKITPVLIELDKSSTPEEEQGIFLNPDPEEEQGTFATPDEKREHLQNKKLEDEISLRKQYAKTSKCLTYAWAIFSIVMTVLQFFKPWGKHLEQAEFIAIVATAIATIITLYVQVGKGMFPK
jgi:hypothetical protein